ncbi:FAD/NAD(P)-binding oxidoreductase [Kitasatospora sp. MMS16-BH015]|uniref:FAD/NAD(P)-dependent oxidoreductase n=1 Tax=Kitasatospora sp. MMS16-BH015 TaxID=2018025 RepID=UPI000CA1DD8D|nr:NAD(P)/FAD-dependent oxidoreductase [Kitasatospora sp. MMS16-BH015]AUG76202.1 FAD/NAD(P)-binding oxidoreductase [Kitasatospora sp. MMS16-BH015]
MPTSPSEPQESFDLAVIGAGPAGLAAAVTAAELGLRCALLDAGPRPGGQYYRHPAPGLKAAHPEKLHHGWGIFTGLSARLKRQTDLGRLTYLTEHQVWTAETGEGWRLHATTGPGGSGGTAVVPAAAVLLATGAYERQLPFPGWTLPGVVTAGGAQAMLKAGLVLPGKRIVVAGSGPLLLAAASSLVSAGASVPAVVEATDYLGYARGVTTLAANPAKLVEGAEHGAKLLRHGVRLRRSSAVVQAHGTDRVTGVTIAKLDRQWRPVPGTERYLACDAVAIGHGLVPQIELATELGAETVELGDGTVGLRVDAELRTSLPGLWAAGETCGVGGADLAVAEGELAARVIAGREVPGGLRARQRRRRAFAGLMAAAHRPGPGWPEWLTPETDVCRCEEVSVAKIREAVDDLGAGDARTVKLLTRAGMGWCQGRMCGAAVACLAGGGAPRADSRPLAGPVRLGDLAAVPADDPTY